jgi:hemolysin III
MTARGTVSRHEGPREIAADIVVHVFGTGAGMAGAVAIVRLAAASGDAIILAASSVYAVGMVVMFAASAACNIAFATRYGQMLRRFDHAAIFIMIAGTYTPFTLCRLHGGWAAGLTAAEWVGALAGAAMKLTRPGQFERLSLYAYLALGWLFVIAARPVYAAISGMALGFLAAGGALYTIGIVFYLRRSLPYHNAIWHSFVVAAVVCHYVSILDGVVLAAGH